MLALLIFIEYSLSKEWRKNSAKNGGNTIRDRIFSVQKIKYISNYNNTNMCETLKSHLLGMASTIAPDASLARQVCRKQSEF